jgi:hypothetical protein
MATHTGTRLGALLLLSLSSLAQTHLHAAPPETEQRAVTISNKEPRLDSTGSPVNAHSGNIVGPINGTYFLCAFARLSP